MNNSGDKAVIIKLNKSQRMDKLEIKLKEVTDIIYDQDKELDIAVNNICHLEKAMYNQQQYTRREKLEIIGIPESVLMKSWKKRFSIFCTKLILKCHRMK